MIYSTFFHHPLRKTKAIPTEVDFNTELQNKRRSPDPQHHKASD